MISYHTVQPQFQSCAVFTLTSEFGEFVMYLKSLKPLFSGTTTTISVKSKLHKIADNIYDVDFLRTADDVLRVPTADIF